MRIAGYIEHPHMKVTIFQMDNRYSVKFELGLLEQTYKFRTAEQLESVADVRRLIDQSFQLAVLDQFGQMNTLRKNAELRFSDSEDDEFDEII